MTFNQFKFYIQANWIKTLYVNFKLLPFKDAVKCPILIFGRCFTQISDDAKVEFINGDISFASVFIGNTSSAVWGFNIRPINTSLIWNGLITFSGKKQFIGNGSCINVAKGAHLYLGDHVIINNNVKLCCQQRIHLDDRTGVSWECQVFDTNFHYLVDENGHVGHKSGCIHIGKNCWIGNRVTIQKGTVLEDDSTVASNSLINKDFSGIKYGLFAGSPAKLLKTGMLRSRNYALEYKLDDYFATYPEISVVEVDLEAAKKFFDFDNLDIKPIK